MSRIGLYTKGYGEETISLCSLIASSYSDGVYRKFYKLPWIKKGLILTLSVYEETDITNILQRNIEALYRLERFLDDVEFIQIKNLMTFLIKNSPVFIYGSTFKFIVLFSNKREIEVDNKLSGNFRFNSDEGLIWSLIQINNIMYGFDIDNIQEYEGTCSESLCKQEDKDEEWPLTEFEVESGNTDCDYLDEDDLEGEDEDDEHF